MRWRRAVNARKEEVGKAASVRYARSRIFSRKIGENHGVGDMKAKK